MAEEVPITSRRANVVGLIAVMALGLTMVSAGVLMRRQQGRNWSAATVTQNALQATDVPLVDAAVSTVTPQAEEAVAPPQSTPSATSILSAMENPLAGATAAPTPTPIPVQSVAIQETYAAPSEAPPIPIPTPADPIEVTDDIINIMLLGSDKRPDDAGYRTDTIIIVSINRDEGTASMLSFPRDLYVYIPGWTMGRINTADSHGSAVGWPGGGPGLLRETLLYNFGIETHYYARVDFDGFRQVVDTLGGIDVPVACPVEGYKLIDPSVTADDFERWDDWVAYTANEDNWEPFSLGVGVHRLDGYMALRYARTRKGGSDFERAYHQQQVLRAIWNEAVGLGWLEPGPESVSRLSSLWVTGNEVVETDMGLGNILQLAPIAAELDTSRISSYFIGPDPEVLEGWQTPDGQLVYLPIPGAIEEIASYALQPPAANQAAARTATVEVRNGTSVDRLDEVAADNLGWEGLIAVPTGPADRSDYEETVIYDFKGTTKGSQLYTLQQQLAVPFDRVITQPDPARSVDYLVVLGDDYTTRTCSY